MRLKNSKPGIDERDAPRRIRAAMFALMVAAFMAASSPECAVRFVRERVISRDIKTSMDATGNLDAAIAWIEKSRSLFPGGAGRKPDGTVIATGTSVIRGGAETMQGRYMVVFRFRDRGIYAVASVGPATENYRLRAAIEEFARGMFDDLEKFLENYHKPGAD